MKRIDKIKHSLDTFQQKHSSIGLPVAAILRFGEDKVGQQAALITYYGFLALFPLLLLFITFVSMAASGNPQLQKDINAQIFQFFPALGGDLQGNVHTLKGSGLSLILEGLVLLYGARGLAVTLQDAFNHTWHSKLKSSNVVLDNLRSFAMLTVVGVGVVVGTVITYGLSVVLDVQTSSIYLVTAVNAVVLTSLFLVVFRLGTASSIRTKYLIVGAVISGIGILIVQHFGVAIMGQELPKLRGTYGSFALTLGMIFWIYLQAQIVMMALVITAVRAQRDWPRKLFG